MDKGGIGMAGGVAETVTEADFAGVGLVEFRQDRVECLERFVGDGFGVCGVDLVEEEGKEEGKKGEDEEGPRRASRPGKTSHRKRDSQSKRRRARKRCWRDEVLERKVKSVVATRAKTPCFGKGKQRKSENCEEKRNKRRPFPHWLFLSMKTRPT